MWVITKWIDIIRSKWNESVHSRRKKQQSRWQMKKTNPLSPYSPVCGCQSQSSHQRNMQSNFPHRTMIRTEMTEHNWCWAEANAKSSQEIKYIPTVGINRIIGVVREAFQRLFTYMQIVSDETFQNEETDYTNDVNVGRESYAFLVSVELLWKFCLWWKTVAISSVIGECRLQLVYFRSTLVIIGNRFSCFWFAANASLSFEYELNEYEMERNTLLM